MRVVTKEKIDQAKREIRERKDRRNVYVKSWRQGQRTQRRISSFIEEYVREKFSNIYSEALNFYTALDTLYPKKIDLRKTTEFRSRKQTIRDGNDSVILTPVIPLNEAAQNQTRSNRSTDQSDQQRGDNLVLRIPLLPHPSIPQTPETQVETQPEISVGTPPEIPPSQPSTPPEIPPSQPSTPPEIPPSQPSTPPEIPPFQPSTLPEIGAEFTVEMPLLQLESLAGPDSENIDQRIQQIIEELQNDPDLDGIFDYPHPAEQIDEGIEDDIFW